MAKTINEAGIAPVRKTLTVPLAPAKAFQLFTADIASWWPLANVTARQPAQSHRLGGHQPQAKAAMLRLPWAKLR